MTQTSQIYKHCELVYKTMLEQSNSVDVEGMEYAVYEGFLTRLFQDLGLAVPYYTQIMNELKRMKCVRQLKRGGGSSPSKWILFDAPTENKFWSAPESAVEIITRSNPNAKLQQQINDLNRRVTILEQVLGVQVLSDETEDEEDGETDNV